MQLSCPEVSLRDWQRCQCAARQCRAAAFRCEKLRFDQGRALGAPDVTVGPSHFAAHLRCVSAKEGKGSQEGTGNHTWCPVPFCPPPWARRLRRRRRPLCTLTLSVNLASSGRPPNRRNRLPSADGKEKKTSAEGIRKRLPFSREPFFCFTSAYAADFRNYSSTFT